LVGEDGARDDTGKEPFVEGPEVVSARRDNYPWCPRLSRKKIPLLFKVMKMSRQWRDFFAGCSS
jgi:hypothetical protein